MKSYLYLLILIAFSACSGNTVDKNCNFLLDVRVDEPNINLDLPEFGQLKSVGNSIYLPNAGNKGIIITNAGYGFLAWDAADPNHSLQPCSIVNGNGLEGTCGCEDKNKYSFITGQPLENPELRCGLKNYRVEKTGNLLRVYN